MTQSMLECPKFEMILPASSLRPPSVIFCSDIDSYLSGANALPRKTANDRAIRKSCPA
jgi:hypothetical protein